MVILLDADKIKFHAKIMCKYCHDEAFAEINLLDCKYLQGKNKIFSYIPDYNDLFNKGRKEQIYISRLLKENFKRFKLNKTMWTTGRPKKSVPFLVSLTNKGTLFLGHPVEFSKFYRCMFNITFMDPQ